MIRVFKSGEVARADILYRGESGSTQAVEDAVADILADVKKNGDAAVLRYCEKFDGVKLAGLRVAQADIDAAYEAADPEFIRTLTMAAGNIEAFHKRQIRRNFVINDTPGVVLGQKVTPIERVGLYVPGGTASYPSSVLMNAIPARLAGVSEIIMVTPPAKDGSVAPAILTAARVAGVTAIYKMGGAQAVAALAYGTESVPKVDKIVGPGNIFVAAAKRRVYGIVDIDMIAGPSEILVLADAAANPAYVAADLLSQAEHDRLATAVLVCDSEALAGAVSAELERQIPLLPRADIARASIDNNGKIIIARDMAEGVDIANEIAPEHLEVCVDDPFSLLNSIRNAGSIFLGKNVPEALGDYFAGPNHTLPTLGTARFSGHSYAPFDLDYSVKSEQHYVQELRALQKAYAGRLRIAVGMEADWFAPVNDRAALDYIIGSVHYLRDEATGRYYAVDGAPEALDACVAQMFGGDALAMARAYYALVAENARKYRPELIGHFDLVKKNNCGGHLFDEADPVYRTAALEALDACAATGAVFEVNTGGMFRGYCGEPYPSRFLLEALRECSYTVKKQQHKLRTAYPTILYQSGAVTRKCCCSIFMPLK